MLKGSFSKLNWSICNIPVDSADNVLPCGGGSNGFVVLKG